MCFGCKEWHESGKIYKDVQKKKGVKNLYFSKIKDYDGGGR